MIEDLGHSVVEADLAPRAHGLLSTHPKVDLVITDYTMPGMTGTDLAAELKHVRPGLPVVIATGYSDAPEGVSLPRLNKPYRQQDLATLFAALFCPLPVLYGNEEAPTPAAI